ncbi:MAG: carotenoid 1,2-hydratase [Amphritea sp.]|nr:carotenoid 1,2-hydratase [Amphritea sp.]
MQTIFKTLILILTLSLLASSAATADTTFSKVTPGRQFSFPQDHLLHPDYQNEWWYVTTNLQDKAGNQYGAQFTLFSNADLYSGTQQRVFFAHAALSSKDSFYHAERYARADMQHAGVSADPWLAYIDHWRFDGSKDSPLPGRLRVQDPQFSYDLTLSDSGYYLQGEDGFSRKNSDGSMASYYYSAPFIDIRGQIEIAGKAIEVTGTGWLDREWSSQLIRFGSLGWDWLSLHLDEDTALMLYRTRIDEETYLYGRLMYRDGRQQPLQPEQIKWLAKRNKVFGERTYPIAWTLEIPDHGISLNLQPINDDQFVNARVPYWEGAVTGSGSHQAQGYLELFGERQ